MNPAIVLLLVVALSTVPSLALIGGKLERHGGIGGPSPTQPEVPVNPEVRNNVLSVDLEIKKLVASRFTSPPPNFYRNRVVPISYRRQPRPSTGGDMDFVKILIGEYIFHVGVYKRSWEPKASVSNLLRGPLSQNEPIYPFDCLGDTGKCTVTYE